MSDFLWGLEMTLVGMGTVFALLALLMGALVLLGKVDRPAPQAAVDSSPEPQPLTATTVATPATEAEPEPSIEMEMLTGQLSVAEAAAVVMAVVTHAQLQRQEAAPAMRTFAPGSQIHTSRWVAVGRASQNQSWNRR